MFKNFFRFIKCHTTLWALVVLTFRLKNSPVSHLTHITPHMHACGTSLLGTLSPGTSSRGKGVSLQYTERDASTLFTLSCIESGPYTLLWYSNEYQKILRLKIHRTSSLIGRGSYFMPGSAPHGY